MTRLQLLAAVSFLILVVLVSGRVRLLPDYQELLARNRPVATHKLPYGSRPDQFGELWLPPGKGPHPVVVMIHGGCWLNAFFGFHQLAYLAEDLRKSGIASWNLEYRRLGTEGGGYPGTFLDVAAGADHLRQLEKRYALDLSRVVTLGHSAGGHLALWTAGRGRLKKGGTLYQKNPLRIHAAVSMAGINDLAAYRVDGPSCGGPDTIDAISGGPDLYAQTSPAAMLPLRVPQIIASGGRDEVVPQRFGDAYGAAAKAAGDKVDIVNIGEAGHMDFIDPGSEAWKQVKASFLPHLK